MNKKFLILAIVVVLVAIGVGFFIYSNSRNSENENSYQANRTSTETNETSKNENKDSKKEPIEEQLSTFSTKILSSDSSRQHNIELTCNRLNGTIVKDGDLFSFYEILGPSTKEKGYLEADILDQNGKKQKGFGGGNCQISSTLYNAVLAVPSLIVTERHEHSNYVPYIEKGKDAAVSYGNYDFKFRNNSGNDVKIVTLTDGNVVTATLISIK